GADSGLRAESQPSCEYFTVATVVVHGRERPTLQHGTVGDGRMLIALLVPLGLAILLYVVILARAAFGQRVLPKIEAVGLGAVVNFFDTLGIGSFATTTAWLKFRKLVPDCLLPP